MNYRKLGRTGLEVSEIGYGAWGIAGDAWLGARDEESLQALNRAVDLGLNFIDTALAYGEGHSERLVGKIIAERDETIHVATKIPPKNLRWPAPAGLRPDEVFPGDYVRKCTEESLKNLGVDALDVQQFHVWQDEWLGGGDWQETVENLKSEGKIRHFGVSINDHQPANAVRLIETGLVDTVQVIYNVFDQSPEDELLPACRERGVGVIVRVPFDEGALTGTITPETEFEEGDFRNHYFAGDRRRPGAGAGHRHRAWRHRGRGRRDGPPLHPQPSCGLDGHPGHALRPQRRAEHARRRRPGIAGRAGAALEEPPLGPQLLRLAGGADPSPRSKLSWL